MQTKVVHCKKARYDIYIGRPSKWGNPFSHKNLPGIVIRSTREEAVESYRTWLLTQPHLMAALPELKGKVLGCWCKPNSCHGDVLAELANGT